MGLLKTYGGWFLLCAATYSCLAWGFMLYNQSFPGWTVFLCVSIVLAWTLWFLRRRKKGKKAKRKNVPTAIGMVFAAILAIAGAWCLWDLFGTLQLKRVRADLVEQGYADLYAPPERVSAEENGAVWFSKAVQEVDRLFALLDAKTPEGQTKPSEFVFELKSKMPYGPMSANEWMDAYRLVKANRKAFALFEKACEQETWDWGVDWEAFYSGQKVSLPEWGTPVSMMDLWLLKCFLEMRAGQTETAREDARKGLMLAEHFSNDPWMSEFLYGSTAKVIFLKQLAPLWLEGEWPDELSADREYARFLKIGRTVLLNSARDYDAGVLAAMMRPGERPLDADPDSMSTPWVLAAFIYKPFLKIERSWLGSWGKRVLNGMKPSAPDLAARTRAARQSMVPWNTRTSIWAFEYHLENVFYCMTQMRLHKALASCWDFKRITDRWPVKTEEMVNVTASDNDLMDPFAPTFLRLTTKNDRLLLYSVGRNFVDDGGVPIRENGADGDIVLGAPSWVGEN